MRAFDFILKPNLPDRPVGRVIINREYPQAAQALKKFGIEPLLTDGCADILPALSNHADMLFSYLGNGEFLIEKSQTKLNQQLKSIGMNCVDTAELLADYPNDVLLNSCVIGGKVICSEKNTHRKILDNKTVINVKQGYAKCSCAVVDETSIITDDESICSAALRNGIDALLVSKGDVILNGFKYGFIGGCCGKIAPDVLAFCGDIRTHRDYERIQSFLASKRITPVSLFGGKLIDIGSIIPITVQN